MTLLFAVLIASLALSLGIAVYNVTLKELRLSTVASESQKAFFSADTGWECAMYHDFQDDTVFDVDTPDPADSTVRCAGAARPVQYDPLTDPDEYRWRFRISSTTDATTVCAGVTVYKQDMGAGTPNNTRIVSDGFNTCEDTVKDHVQRTIRIDY